MRSVSRLQSVDCALRTPNTSSACRRPTWRSAGLLRVLCEELRPRSVLDLGSGFTSFVFREYARQSATEVWSVDDDATWLERSRRFVESHHAGSERMLLWQAFVHGPRPAAFDLVCHDLGGMATRSQLLPHVLSLVGEDGVVILDAMHKEEYAPWVDLALCAG